MNSGRRLSHIVIMMTALPLLGLVGESQVVAQDTVAVMVGAPDNLDACMSMGEVVNLSPVGDGFLAVRSGPGTQYAERDRLHLGDPAFACDEMVIDGERWTGIVYGQDCGVSSPIARRAAYAGPCRSGWVHSRYFEITAG